MKIRSITLMMNPKWPLDLPELRKAGLFIQGARQAFTEAGYEVQTARLATTPFSVLLGEAGISDGSLVRLSREIEAVGAELGLAYIALGPAQADLPGSYAAIPDAVAATQNVFFSGQMSTADGQLSLAGVQACAQVIHALAPVSPDGFANLRFAALANVPAGAPFFPAAYHGGGQPAFALATEAADLAVEAFGGAATLQKARQRLVQAVESHAARLCRVGERLEAQFKMQFTGIDFSLAPYPERACSLGEAVERLGVPAVGQHGSLAAAALLAESLDRARFPHVGFSGLMLPVLEDAVLAQRAAEGVLTVKDMLLYSAVCGTGLDTVPLPGDASVEQLAALLLDVAVLAHRLDKPLTARLMPVPGKKAGEPTGFDFEFFANSRVMALEAGGLMGALAGSEPLEIITRGKPGGKRS